ncbi:hypothetical protein MWU75_04570 [Ornithinimicrobium sp. F0845]|uniref:hypothetical protein n=1 Tax=Ornithinimicrobium sp. F0845 TaxID=2926412 RepID=UPI001FF4CF07|nr:hypothetical protein [Ornithinimicrobium sp. F0845]MCK0111409.1 hypothetical protein [Ornithinimicrobium sp. F0845]
MRRWGGWMAGVLLLLSLGLPWVPARGQYIPGSGPSCIADLSGSGGLICDYIGTAAINTLTPVASGADTPSRFFLVLALVLLAWHLASGRTAPALASAGAAVAGVALSLPLVLSGQATTLLAAVLLVTVARPPGSSPAGTAPPRRPGSAARRP